MIDSLRDALESFRLWATPWAFLFGVVGIVVLAGLAVYDWLQGRPHRR